MTSTTTQANKTLIRDYFRAWDHGDVDAITEFFAEDFSTSYKGWNDEEVRVNPEDVRDWIAGWQETFSGMTHEIQELVAEGDQVVAQITYQGVHTGPLYDIEPTGNTIEVDEFLRFRIDDGAIVEFDWLSDDLALLQQLNVDLPIHS